VADESLGRIFDRVADLYDEVRPDYPAALYELLEATVGPIADRRVVDLAAGPGLASRQLRARGARVVAVEPGANLTRTLHAGAAGLPVVRAVAEALPFRGAVFDLATCATAWHWLDAAATVAEVRRVVRPGGHLALWWADNRHGDGIDWEDAQSAVFEQWERDHGTVERSVGVRPSEAAADLTGRGLEVLHASVVEWERQVTREHHLQLLRTFSVNLALGAAVDELIGQVAAALEPWPVVTERLHGPLVVARIGAEH
jgi:SAM-dependent methyltransferase